MSLGCPQWGSVSHVLAFYSSTLEKKSAAARVCKPNGKVESQLFIVILSAVQDVRHRLRGAVPGNRSNHLVFLGRVRGERGKTAAATGRSRKGGATLRPGSRTRAGLLRSGRPRGPASDLARSTAVCV